MALSTIELRWFFTAELHESVESWFKSTKPWAGDYDAQRLQWPPKWRDDTYLHVGGHPDMGIKLRGAPSQRASRTRIDIKGRTARLGELRINEQLFGCPEMWTKWSYVGDTLARLLSGEKTPLFITVRKKRLLRHLSLDAFANAREITSQESPMERGIHIELTQIECGDIRAWTLGFEAFPADHNMLDAFWRNVRVFLRSYHNTELNAEMSMGYPAWIERVVR